MSISIQIPKQELKDMEAHEKRCIICGVNVEKKDSLGRYGKRFCSEEHVQAYADAVESDCGCC
jgi:hypothetical protein